MPATVLRDEVVGFVDGFEEVGRADPDALFGDLDALLGPVPLFLGPDLVSEILSEVFGEVAGDPAGRPDRR